LRRSGKKGVPGDGVVPASAWGPGREGWLPAGLPGASAGAAAPGPLAALPGLPRGLRLPRAAGPSETTVFCSR